MQTYSTPTSSGPTTVGGSGDGGASATDQARDKAQQAAGQASGALRRQVDQRSTEAGEKVGTFASDVRSVSSQLREQGKDQPAKLADQAAERAERVSSYLKQTDGDRILGDVEDFGRRNPWVMVAGGAMLGLAAARFLKASSSRRYEQRFESSSQLPARTYDVSPTASGIHTGPVTSEPLAPADTRPLGTGTGPERTYERSV